ncbi:MAG: FadR family transcriptional regulator [Gorillibacterium sp.]|nr:FadR family transcriptional regulator [Gorillibacterium sp.]
MSFQQIKPQKGSEIVMHQIKQQILSGAYPPTAKLPTVVELAASFEVGRSTIREALSALKAMGWVDIRHGGGTFVSKVLPSELGEENGGLFYKTESFQEVLEVRKFIEVGCAALAAERRTEADLAGLESILSQMEASIDNEELSDQADIGFHLQIARASHNSLFVSMMESVAQRLQTSMRESRRLWFFAERASAELLLQEHREIYLAIQDMHVELASTKMMQHIMKVDGVVHRLTGNIYK